MKKQQSDMNHQQPHQLPVDIDALWSAIEPEVDEMNAERKKKKKRFLLFWLFGAALFLAACLTWTWSSQSSVDQELSSLPQTKEATPVDAFSKNPSSSNKDQLSTAPNALDWVSTPKDESSLSLKKGNHSLLKTKASSDQILDASVDENEQMPLLQAAKASDNTHKNSFSTKFSTPKFWQPTDVENLVENINMSGKSRTFPVERVDKTGANNKINKIQHIAFSTIPMARTPLLTLAVEKASPPILSDPRQEENDSYLHEPVWCFAVLPYTGLSATVRSLESKGEDPTSLDRLMLREATESVLEVQQYGLLAQLIHESGFTLSTGLQFSQLTERYSNQSTIVEVDTIQGVVSRVVQLNGDTLDFIGSVPRTRTSTFDKRIYNRYRLLDIPVLIGYEREVGAWKLGLQLGLFANLSLTTEGKILDTSSTEIELDNRQEEVFKSQLGMNYYAGLTISREFFPGLDIQLRPHARIFPGDWSVEDYSIAQKYRFLGLDLGARWTIGK